MDANDVWNRNADGACGELLGDQHLARAIAFDSHAQGDGVLDAVESLVGELLVGETMDAFAWFGLDDVAALIDDVAAAEADPDDAGPDDRFHRLDVTDRLSAALSERLRDDADSFAPAGTQGPGLPQREIAADATVVGYREKGIRTVMALNALGVGAVMTVEGGVQLIDEEGDASLDQRIMEVLDLVDRWLVTADELDA